MNDIRKTELETLLKGKKSYIGSVHYDLVSKYGISKEEMVEYLLSIGDEMIEDDMFQDYDEIYKTLWNKLSDKYKNMDKFYIYNHGISSRERVKLFLLNMNKTNHNHIDITHSHRRGYDWLYSKRDGCTVESILRYIESLDHPTLGIIRPIKINQL